MGRHQKSIGRIGSLIALLLLACLPAFAADIMVIDVKDAISPPVASFINEHIDKAVIEGHQAIIVRLDTPGGLDTAMRDIIQKEMNAPIPVIIYVYPKGARAASAGAIINLASDIAVMAPGTNMGAAHPVSIGGTPGKSEEEGQSDTMTEKVTNDAVAYSRSIAKERGRPMDWAEDAVAKSISTPAHEALKLGVIDIVAADMDDLLKQLDGRKVSKNGRDYVLNTKDANLIVVEMSFRYRLLSAISNPNIAYILMMIGLAGLYFELSNPGAIFPGVIGGISLILAFFAFQTLPINIAGIALILLAILLFIAELKVPSFGLLSIGGVISMVLGSVLLFDTPEMYIQVSYAIILPIALTFSLFFVCCIYLVLQVHRSRTVSGEEALVGISGEVYSWEGGQGKVYCHGEYWNAVGAPDLAKGDSVEVTAAEGMTLTVMKKQ